MRGGGGALTARDGLRVLVVDDDKELLSALQNRYEQRAFEVQLASTRAEALRLVSDWTPDVALVDLHLGSDEDGIRVVRDLRCACPSSRIVLISAAVSGETASLAHQVGANAVVEKPKPALGYLGLETDEDSVDRTESRIPTFEQMKRALVDLALREADGNYSETARLLEIPRRTLVRWLDKWGIR